tara:strand:- start:7580 stop:8083 length:504 start_codon:yes stop_codon:yes gene_type:complete
MKKLALLLGMSLLTAPAYADITHRLSSSVQLNVNSAATQMTRIGNTFSTSGSGVNSDIGGGNSVDNKLGGFGTLSHGVASSPSLPTITQATAGEAFSYSVTFTQGDALVTSAPAVGAVSPLSQQTSNAAGVAGSLAGVINADGSMTLTAGGAGTSATGQFVTEIYVK